MKVTGIDIRTLPYDEAGLTRRTIYVARLPAPTPGTRTSWSGPTGAAA